MRLTQDLICDPSLICGNSSKFSRFSNLITKFLKKIEKTKNTLGHFLCLKNNKKSKKKISVIFFYF